MNANVTIFVMQMLKDTEERDVDFLIGQTANCARDSDRRDAIKSFRRQMIVAAAETAQESSAFAQRAPKSLTLTDITIHNNEVAQSIAAQRAPNHGNALTDVGPDFRVVSVRVLQSAYDRIDAMLASIEPDLRAANSVRIELRHLINERHTGAAVTSTDSGAK